MSPGFFPASLNSPYWVFWTWFFSFFGDYGLFSKLCRRYGKNLHAKETQCDKEK
jgi:hypothetical protein